jgi:hypothetical protein
MTIKNCAVTAGYLYSYDANGEFKQTLERFNLQAVPIVTVNLTSSVDTEDLVPDAVGFTELDDDVADEILTATATVSDEVTNVITVTIQVLDGKGESLAAVCVLDFWISDAAAGAITAGTMSTGVAATTGTVAIERTANTDVRCVTDASGALVLTFTDTAVQEFFFNMIVNNKYVAGSQSMDFVA